MGPTWQQGHELPSLGSRADFMAPNRHACCPISSASHGLPEPPEQLGNTVALARACGPRLGVRTAQSYIPLPWHGARVLQQQLLPWRAGENFSLAKPAMWWGLGIEVAGGIAGRAGVPGAIKVIESPLP